MSGYQQRAPFYRSEFTVQDDFALLGRLLAGKGGLVVDIPSGAGRLLPVHRSHARDVIMVDIEPAMVEQCRAAAASAGLARRVSAVPGDITTWQAPHPAARVVIARGGLQMLASLESVTRAVTVSAANLAPAGLLYLDVAMPWTAAPAAAPDLAPFLRFTGTTRLQGQDRIRAGGVCIRRSYTSVLLPDRVSVSFRYRAEGPPASGWLDFDASASWRKIDAPGLLGTLADAGLTTIAALGDYAGTPYAAGSGRLICIAKSA